MHEPGRVCKVDATFGRIKIIVRAHVTGIRIFQEHKPIEFSKCYSNMPWHPISIFLICTFFVAPGILAPDILAALTVGPRRATLCLRCLPSMLRDTITIYQLDITAILFLGLVLPPILLLRGVKSRAGAGAGACSGSPSSSSAEPSSWALLWLRRAMRRPTRMPMAAVAAGLPDRCSGQQRSRNLQAQAQHTHVSTRR